MARKANTGAVSLLLSLFLVFLSGCSAPESPPVQPARSIDPLPFESTWTFTAVGDIMLSRFVADRMRRFGEDFPFALIKEQLTGDVIFGNLENPIASGAKVPLSDTLMLRADPVAAKVLQRAGFTILSLANNHLTDSAGPGVRSTIALLDAQKILHAGAGNTDTEAYAPAIFTVKGVQIALLAYADPRFVPQTYPALPNRAGVAFGSVKRITDDVSAVRKDVDVVIVSIHAGTEYRDQPDKMQTQLAEAAIDAGADVVLGHHPHVLQPMVIYKDKPIFYSLGNFVFDQFFSGEVLRSAMVKFHFTGKNLTAIEIVPIHIRHTTQPTVASGADVTAITRALHMSELAPLQPQ